ncbi:MAG: DUF6514 family protein [Defluviitaleaceae bacterium]|nr:DUF6514 family protein [Defluviitaleaceae bacterium]
MMKAHMSTVQAGDFELRYYKTTQPSADGSMTFHGVYVAKCSGEHIIEQADSGPIGEDSRQVDTVIHSLAENTVTPMVLYEVLDELLSMGQA